MNGNGHPDGPILVCFLQPPEQHANLLTSPQTITKLRSLINDACSNKEFDLPCASVMVVGKEDRSATELFFHSTGGINEGHYNGSEIYWLASCTKLVTGIACMRLVERGTLDLDNADQIERFCPELKDIKVLGEDGILVEKTERITLRMLLTHTAGFGYSFLNKKLKEYAQNCNSNRLEYDEFSGQMQDFLQPLLNQPGERFEYGISVDWAGLLVERAIGVKLNDYIQGHIFEPLNVKDMSMVPSKEMKERLQGLWQRDEHGRLNSREYPLNRPLSEGQICDNTMINSGGSGLFGSVKGFGKILMALLCDGTSLSTGHEILSPSTVSEMFTNQIPHMPNFGRKPLPAIKPDLVYLAAELYPLALSKPQGWGLTFMLSPGVTGRSSATAHWSGLSNVFWWCDRDKGIAGVVGSQILPFVDPKAAGLWAEVEGLVYEGLQQAYTER
ncbi:hypothetical protein N7526_001662 [Penicillium atrosanguineum]|nr:hypothetical protein N7526_001662 [Penicillium atrosanguineum]